MGLGLLYKLPIFIRVLGQSPSQIEVVPCRLKFDKIFNDLPCFGLDNFASWTAYIFCFLTGQIGWTAWLEYAC